MARFPALATSLAVHAVAFAAVVLIPIFGNEPLPTTGGASAADPRLAAQPQVALADSPPAPARSA